MHPQLNIRLHFDPSMILFSESDHPMSRISSELSLYYFPRQETQLPFKGANKQEFFQALPTKFKREEAIAIAQKYNIKPRTADNLLKKLVKQGFLTQPDYGIYMKSSQAIQICTYVICYFLFCFLYICYYLSN